MKLQVTGMEQALDGLAKGLNLLIFAIVGLAAAIFAMAVRNGN